MRTNKSDSRRQIASALLLGALLLPLSSSRLSAQVLYGSIVGDVTDQTEAAVPGAKVTATHRETNQTRVAETNAAGQYRFLTIPGGTYDIRIERDGFSPTSRTGIAVATNSTTRVDVSLKIGAVAESIEVSAAAALLQTDRSEVRSEVTAKTLLDTPVPPGRNYQQLFNMLPGFTSPRNAHSIPSNPSRALQFEVNGTVAASNNVRLDGATQYNVWLPHVTAYVPALESIEAVNVVTNSFDAEQGLAGGAAINVQIKSGTNDLHGSAFEYHNNNQMKAKPFFMPQGERNPKLVFNQFGATVGGPLKRDRIFYFVSYEGTRDREFAGNLYTVPTANIRKGIMSESDRPVYDPATGNPDGSGRIPFAGNIVPVNRQDPISLKLVGLLPLPTDPGLLTSNFYSQGGFAFDRDTLDSKVNFNLTDKLTSYVRFSYLDYRSQMPTAFGEFGGPVIKGGNPGSGFGNTYSVTAAATYTFSPTFIFDTNFGYTLMDTNVEQSRLEENLGLDFLGIPGTNGTRRFEGGWPGFGISNYTTFGLNESYMPYFRRDPQYQWIGNGNWTVGRHNLRFGAELSWQQLNHTQPEFYGGSWGAPGGFSFGGGPTQIKGGPSSNQWNTFSTFLLGLPTQIGKIYQWPDEYSTRTSMQSMYFRDQWQINRKLTLNMGVRWNYFPMPTRGDRGMERYWFPGTGDAALDNKVWVCGVGTIPEDCGVKMSKKLFAPTVGIAWRLNETTVIRTGYGLNTDPWNMARAMRTNHPLLTAQTVNAPSSLYWAGTLKTGVPVIQEPELGNGIVNIPNTVVTNTLDSEFHRGYTQSWNLTIQKNFHGWVGQAGYVATRQTGLLGYEERNYGLVGGGASSRIYYGATGRNVSTAVVNRVGNSAYDSLQLTLDRRFSNGFQSNFAYTWSKCMSVAGFGNSGDRPSIKIPEYFGLNRSLCGIDQAGRFTANGIYELPFGKGKRWATGGFGAAILGGWQVNGLLSMFSGNPFTVSSSGTSLNAPENSQRADWVGGSAKPTKLGGVGRGQAFYDWTQWAPVTQARFGNAGFNILRGPGMVNLDFGVFRQFKMGERFSLHFRGEAFNLTNTPHFSNPSNNISNLRLNSDGTFRSGTFEVTGTRNTGREGIDERVFRVGLRFGF